MNLNRRKDEKFGLSENASYSIPDLPERKLMKIAEFFCRFYICKRFYIVRRMQIVFVSYLTV